jgi:hypothetical protein
VKLQKTPEVSGFYVPSATKEQYVCYRSRTCSNFFYFKKGSEELDYALELTKNGEFVVLSGTLYDIKDQSR